MSFRAKPRNQSRSYTIRAFPNLPTTHRNPTTHPSSPAMTGTHPYRLSGVGRNPGARGPSIPASHPFQHGHSPQPDHTPVIPGNDRNPPIPSFRRRPEPRGAGTRQYRRHIPSSTATRRNPTTPPSSPAMTGTHPYRLSGVGRNPGARGHVNTGVTSLPARPLTATRPHPRLPNPRSGTSAPPT